MEASALSVPKNSSYLGPDSGSARCRTCLCPRMYLEKVSPCLGMKQTELSRAEETHSGAGRFGEGHRKEVRRGEGKLGETGGRPDQQQVQEDGAWGQYLRLPGRGVGCV